MLEHPEIGWMERTGYPSWAQETEVLNDEDGEEYEDEIYGDECEDSFFEDRRGQIILRGRRLA